MTRFDVAERRRPAPWDPNDLVRLVTLSLVALAVIGVAWYGASGQGRLSQQMAWLNLSVVGVMIAGAANLMWMARGRRSVGERRRALLASWDPTIARSTLPAPASMTVRDGTLVRVAGMRFAHASGCPLVSGKHLLAVPADDMAPRCGICGPG